MTTTYSATWKKVRRYVGAGLVSFDSKQQALKAAEMTARGMRVAA